MRPLGGTVRIVLATLGLGVGSLAALGQALANEHRLSDWYLAAGAGVTSASGLEQTGRNRDTTCYPDDDCGHLPGGAPAGYRWFYDLHANRGAAAEIAIGRHFGPVRLEVSLAQRRSGVEQEFTGITYLDGSRLMPAAESDYESTSSGSVDDLTTRTLSLNVYRDVPLGLSRITPYVGAGLGVSSVELSGLYYESRYRCRPDTPCDDPGQYDGRQDGDVSDIVPSGHLHVGADMRLGEGLLLGLKLTYSVIGDVEDRGAYAFHRVPGLTGVTEISDIRQWSLMFGVRYRFDG